MFVTSICTPIGFCKTDWFGARFVEIERISVTIVGTFDVIRHVTLLITIT